MVDIIIAIWLFLIVIFTLKDIEWGAALYLAYMVLVPIKNLSLGGFTFGLNYFNVFFLLVYFNHAKKRKYTTTLKPFPPFLFYFFAALIIMPFQSGVPYNIMLNQWRADIMQNLLLPFVLWNVCNNNPRCVKKIRNFFLLSITIAVCYGLILIFFKGSNPYIMSLSGMIDLKDNLDLYFEGGEGRIFGRISSVFTHPMKYACFLGLSFIYVCQSITKGNKYFMIFLVIAILFSAITCGVRSVVVALFVVIAFFLFYVRNYRLMLLVIVFSIGGYFVIGRISGLSSYLESIIDFDNENEYVKGSSLEMRLSQLYGAIKEGSKNPFFGLGYSWTTYYRNLYGPHPLCFAFESLIFVIICNYAFSGFIIWGGLIFLFIKYVRSCYFDNTVFFYCLFIFYIAYSCITGEYGYMRYFIIFYIAMLGNNIETNSIDNGIFVKRYLN